MENVKALIKKMTLEEKAAFCSGFDFWNLKGLERLGIPRIMVTDGPHGLRKQLGDADHVGLNESVPATCFPTASALAATWDRDLVKEVGVALGEECRQEKVGVILGPGANIKRSPLCGRNFEYFSEDPFQSGEMAASHINGVQSQGVGTSLKHFVVNNQETRRMTIDTFVDERTLREIYLAGYERAVMAAQPWTIMCAYNKINGTYASDHKVLMRDILKDEWGHTGIVVTDWGAMNDRVLALKAGTELEMPGITRENDEKIVAAVQSGELDESILDEAVERVVAMILKADETLSKEYSYDAASHHALARKVAGEAAVLLKNEDGILPITANMKVAVLGSFAKYPRYQGAGSSLIEPTTLENFYDEFCSLVGEENVSYADGYTRKGNTIDEALISEAINTANGADVVVICAGLTEMDEVEGIDRTHLNLPVGHTALIERISSFYKHVVVVLSNGAPVEMPWIDSVSAVLEGYLGGQAGGGALADVLTGKVNPCGKLAETFPILNEDCPAQPYPAGPDSVEYREGLYVGYRYYDAANVDVLFPFGYGLSYTTFEYSHLRVKQSGTDVTITCKIKNTGDVAGKEIVQVYVRDVESTVFRPLKELKGFTKIELQPGEKGEVSIPLDARAFAYYDVNSKGWTVEAGEFEILVGASSQDIRLSETIKIKESMGTVSAVDKGKLAAYYTPSIEKRFSQSDFEALLGHSVPQVEKPRKGAYTMVTPISEMKDTFIGRQLHHMLHKEMMKTVEGKEDTPTGVLMSVMSNEMPLRSMLMFGGPLNRPMVEALLMMANGKLFKGLGALLKANRKK
jgi:beta-glucosidase